MRDYLLKRQKRIKARLEELRKLIKDGEVRDEALTESETEVEDLTNELNEVDAALEDLDAEDHADDESDEDDEQDEEDTEDEDGDQDNDNESRSGEQRNRVLGAIGNTLSTRSNRTRVNSRDEVRRAFGRFIAGQIDEAEARQLGIEAGNGSVTVPKDIAREVITYAQEENPLRRLGTIHRTRSTQGFPVLVKKAEAQGHKKERTTSNEMPVTSIEFDEIELDPTEFDALATVTKKLLKRSDVPVEDIVIEELKKAYARKEAQYMFRGDETENINDGALAKKAVEYTPAEAPDVTSGQELYDAFVKFKNTVKSSVRKRSMFLINDAALTLIETMKTDDGFPLFKPFTQAADGFDGKILGFNTVVTEFADKAEDDAETPVVYFGDFKSFHIQDVLGTMEVNRLIELFAKSNLVGLQIYNIVDGQLIYSPLEPTMYKWEVDTTTP